jgi:hypothetical protein
MAEPTKIEDVKMNKRVNKIILEDPAVAKQFIIARYQVSRLLDMLNVRLRKDHQYCEAYTLTVFDRLISQTNFNKQ